MTTRTTTVGRKKQGFRSMLALTATTLALVGGVMLWQLRSTGDATVPSMTSHSRVSDGLTQVREPESRYHEELRAQRGDAEMYSRMPSAASTGSVASVAVGTMDGMGVATPAVPLAVDTIGGMAELYREQRAAAAAERPTIERDCGDGLQPALCD